MSEQYEPRCIVTAIYPCPHPTNTNLRTALLHLGNDREMRAVVVGNHYDDGQLGFFIPDRAIVPEKLAEEMWVLGKLAGKKKSRVRARKIDGALSDGLFYGSQGASWNPEWKIGDDVTEAVGITFQKITQDT